MEIKKLLYSMGEVSEMFDVNPSLIRYWESQFDVLRPKKNKKGNRLFTPEDVQMLKLIYHLVKEQGMTLEGAKRSLKQNRGERRARQRAAGAAATGAGPAGRGARGSEGGRRRPADRRLDAGGVRSGRRAGIRSGG